MLYVIAYDIVDDRRRNLVAKHLEGWGRRVEKSVFECDLSNEEHEQVLSGLKDILEIEEDRCHSYRVCAECVRRKIVLGSDIEKAWPDAVVV